MSNHVLEVCIFSLVPGSDDRSFLEAAEASNSVLHAMPGFVSRRLAKTENGTWTDVVEWADAQSADQAMQSFHTFPAAQPFCAMIDMATAKMGHHPVALAA